MARFKKAGFTSLVSCFFVLVTAGAVFSTKDTALTDSEFGQEKGTKTLKYQLELRLSGEVICGAVLAGSNWALTAAHCLQQASGYVIVAGDLNAAADDTSRQVTRDVRQIIKHSNFQEATYQNDIAILKFDSIETTDLVEPIQVAPADFDIGNLPCYLPRAVGGNGRGHGSGPDHQGLRIHQSAKKLMKVKIITNTACEKKWDHILESNVCLYKPRLRFCMDISGFPLTCLDNNDSFLLAGVGNRKQTKCVAMGNKPDVFARISSFRQWIDENTGSGGGGGG